MKKFVFILVMAMSCIGCFADDTPYDNSRCLWASVNTNGSSIYPSSDTEYKPALSKILVSWRLLPQDTWETAFDVYRIPEGGAKTKISGTNGVIKSTCIQDTYTDFTKNITYELYYKGGTECLASYTIKAEQLIAGVPYVSVPLQAWDGTPAGYWYKVNDCSYGDLDGDGEMEIIVKRGARADSIRTVNGGLSDDYIDGIGNIEKGSIPVWHTTIWEAYKLDGTLLWRVFSGPNIETGNIGAFAVYDFDGDGKCEMATRLSCGSVFGDNKVICDDGTLAENGSVKTTDYRPYQKNMHIHGEPEYLCVIDGQTGALKAKCDYIPKGSSSEAWGDTYWKRAGSIRIAAAKFMDGKYAVLACRGVYARTVMEAYTFDGQELSRLWSFDSDNTGCRNYAGQGYHSLYVGDVDEDGLDEVVYGSMTVDHDGIPLYVSGTYSIGGGGKTTVSGATYNPYFNGYGHGDALHLGDFDPEHPGLEIWSCFETGLYAVAYRDAKTGETIWNIKDAEENDCGRCSIADIFDDNPGPEMWCYDHDAIYSADGTEIKTDAGASITAAADNMAIWFTGSLNRQLLDGNKVCTTTRSTGKERRALRANYFNAKAINGTKENPCLYADLLGDWREEIIYVDSLENNLKIFSTWYPTDYRFYPLATDHLYEMSAKNENIGYNQPTEMGKYLGSDLLTSVTVTETSGAKLYSTKFYIDSLMTTEITNGSLIIGRKYYMKTLKLGTGNITGSFTVSEANEEVLVNSAVKTITTAVNEVHKSGFTSQDYYIYNLNGQRVITPERGKIYIYKGRKIKW